MLPILVFSTNAFSDYAQFNRRCDGEYLSCDVSKPIAFGICWTMAEPVLFKKFYLRKLTQYMAHSHLVGFNSQSAQFANNFSNVRCTRSVGLAIGHA